MRDWLRTFLFTAVWLWTRRQSPSINDCWKKSLPLFLCPALAARAVEVAGAEEYVPSSRPSGGEKKKGRKEEEEGGRGRGASGKLGNDIETVPYSYRPVGQP